MDSTNSSQVKDDDVIDIFEIVETLWDQKLLIVLFSACFVFLGYCYTLGVPEQWTAKMYISEASLPQINSLNPPELVAFERELSLKERLNNEAKSSSQMLSFNVVHDIAPEITPVDLMKSLISEIRSVSNLLQFDAQRSERIFKNSAELTEEERIGVADKFLENAIKITPPSKTTTYTAIELTLDFPTNASSVLNDYVHFVDQNIVKKRDENLRLAITRAIQTNEYQIKRAELSHVLRLEEDLALLEEALRIAQSAGIKYNQTGLFIDRNDDRLTERSDLYLRGERLLKAEIQSLKARISGSSGLIPAVRNLQAENELLRGLVIDTSTASSFFLEKSVTVPTARKSPDTKLVMLVALVLGGMLGMIVALTRNAVRNRRNMAIAKSDFQPGTEHQRKC